MVSSPIDDIPRTWRETPLVESAALSREAKCRIFLKLENMQPSGSFKSRGIGNLIRHHIESHAPGTPLHFYSSSSGNAGLACATAAKTLGYQATIVVGQNTKPLMMEKLRLAGATRVVQFGASWFEADKHLREVELANDPNGVYVPPFEHPKIWEGASTMIDEIGEQMADVGKPDIIVCSVGGGGLFIGVMQGLDRVYGPDSTKVLAVETAGADALSKSLLADKLVTLPAITSIAASLGALRVSETAFKHAQRPNVDALVLEDRAAAMGCWRFLDDERIMVEPSCGASIAVCYGNWLRSVYPDLTPETKVVIVVCGGSAITFNTIMEYKFTYIRGGEEEAEMEKALDAVIAGAKATNVKSHPNGDHQETGSLERAAAEA
ncbi:catabolic L-serine/threonine dehydratase [Thelotrema lepadinum]|nr:catabolic L-serine/threonine dehydratase [Thelotrema lepadinum]